jgi:hypothetical protein
MTLTNIIFIAIATIAILVIIRLLGFRLMLTIAFFALAYLNLASSTANHTWGMIFALIGTLIIAGTALGKRAY